MDEIRFNQLHDRWLEPPEPEDCELCGGSGKRDVDSPPQEDGPTYAHEIDCECTYE